VGGSERKEKAANFSTKGGNNVVANQTKKEGGGTIKHLSQKRKRNKWEREKEEKGDPSKMANVQRSLGLVVESREFGND